MYVKRQEKFDAIQFTGGEESAKQVIEFVREKDGLFGRYERVVNANHTEEVLRLGTKEVREGDWVVFGYIWNRLDLFNTTEFERIFQPADKGRTAESVTVNNYFASDNAALKFTETGLEETNAEEVLRDELQIVPETHVVHAQAMQFTGGLVSVEAIRAWVAANGGEAVWHMAKDAYVSPDGGEGHPASAEHLIVTHDGKSHIVLVNDWVVRDGLGFGHTTNEKMKLLKLFVQTDAAGTPHYFSDAVIANGVIDNVPGVDRTNGMTVAVKDGVIESVEYHDEETMQKVWEALRRTGMADVVINDAITRMQNAGVLFRERA